MTSWFYLELCWSLFVYLFFVFAQQGTLLQEYTELVFLRNFLYFCKRCSGFFNIPWVGLGWETKVHGLIDPMQKCMSLFLLYTNMNQMNSLHHMKEYPKISNFPQLESHSSKCSKLELLKI